MHGVKEVRVYGRVSMLHTWEMEMEDGFLLSRPRRRICSLNWISSDRKRGLSGFRHEKDGINGKEDGKEQDGRVELRLDKVPPVFQDIIYTLLSASVRKLGAGGNVYAKLPKFNSQTFRTSPPLTHSFVSGWKSFRQDLCCGMFAGLALLPSFLRFVNFLKGGGGSWIIAMYSLIAVSRQDGEKIMWWKYENKFDKKESGFSQESNSQQSGKQSRYPF